MTSERVMYAAWASVAHGTGQAGADGVSVETFSRSLPRNIRRLRHNLRFGDYRPSPLRTFTRRSRGRRRVFAIATVRDRLAQRAALKVIGPLLNRHQTPSSFAYRRGRSWQDAVAAVERSRDRGRQWVYRFDITAFFSSIDHLVLRSQLTDLLDEQPMTGLLMSWVAGDLLDEAGLHRCRRGVPLGTPVSATLANHHLAGVDQDLRQGKWNYVRYADDGLILTDEEWEANRAALLVEQNLGELGLSTNPAKSYVSTFARGFSFLGRVFLGDIVREEENRA